MCTLDRICHILKMQKKNQKDLTDYIGLKKGTFTSWKNGSNSSYYKHIGKISEFLGVSADYLLCNEKTVTNDGDGLHAEVIDLFSGLPDDQKQAALSYLQYLANKK